MNGRRTTETGGHIMVRAIVWGLMCVFAVTAAGCCGSGQPAAFHDYSFRRQNERFERQHADHVKKSSDAVRGYLRYRNK